MTDTIEKISESYKKAGCIAEEVRKKVAGKYSEKWPFLNDEEFEDVFGDVEIPENSKCMSSCLDKCCPKSCYFLSERLDECGIYECRPTECRLYFCGGAGTMLWALNNILPLYTVSKTDFSALTPELGKRALEVKTRLNNNKKSPEKAKKEWKEIIQKYRNRKI